MLDDMAVINQRDRSKMLEGVSDMIAELSTPVELAETAHDGREIRRVVIVTDGQSVAAQVLDRLVWHQRQPVAIEMVTMETIPRYLAADSLVIVATMQANASEVTASITRLAQGSSEVAVVTDDQVVQRFAQRRGIMHGVIESSPRRGEFAVLTCMVAILREYHLVPGALVDELRSVEPWLSHEADRWTKESSLEHNFAKQLALGAAGKITECIGSEVSQPVARSAVQYLRLYAKNIAYETSIDAYWHEEAVSWTGQPVEKPFAIVAFRSDLEPQRVKDQYTAVDTLLSGRRPKPMEIWLVGDTLARQLLWGVVLMRYVSLYLAIINGVNPAGQRVMTKLHRIADS